MLDIPSTSAIVAAIGVIVGVVFTVLQLRDLVKARQTDLVMRLYSTFGSKEHLEGYRSIMALDVKDYDEYRARPSWDTTIMSTCVLYEGIGSF